MSAARVLKEMTTQGYRDVPASGGGIVYGPLENGPLGLNLGINLLGNGPKVCSFNCPYCDLGTTELRLNKVKDEAVFPSIAAVEVAVREAFQKIHAVGPVVDGISISGNGEPTLHPDFPEIVKNILAARDLWMPGKRVHLLTNGAGLDARKISDAANLLDERLVKIDAGGEKLFKIVNAPLSRTNLARVLTGARKLRDVTVQSIFFEGKISNTNTPDIEEWLEVIAMMRPKAVHIYGLTRAPAVEGIVRCDQDTLYAIASRLERKTQIRAIVTP